MYDVFSSFFPAGDASIPAERNVPRVTRMSKTSPASFVIAWGDAGVPDRYVVPTGKEDSFGVDSAHNL